MGSVLKSWQRTSLIVAGALSLVAGIMASFVTLPAGCGMTALDVVLGMPDTDGFWLISMALWVISLIVLVARSIERLDQTDPAARLRWLITRLLIVLGWGLLGSGLPYYVLAAPINSLTCESGDGLGTFNILGGGALLLLGACLSLAVAANKDVTRPSSDR